MQFQIMSERFAKSFKRFSTQSRSGKATKAKMSAEAELGLPAD